MSVDVVLDHRSQKWSASTRALVSAVVESKKSGASLVSLTEVADGKRPAALARFGRRAGWGVCQARKPWQHGENAVLYDKAVWKAIDWKVEVIGPDLGPGLVHTAVLVVVEHRQSGERMLYSVTHLPSAVEGLVRAIAALVGEWANRFPRLAPRARSYVTFCRRWLELVDDMADKHDVDTVVLAADWNINLLLKWARRFILSIFRGYKFASDVDDAPTHAGHRKIDGFLIRIRKRPRRRQLAKRAGRKIRSLGRSAQRTLRAHRSSDHRGVRLTGRLPGTDRREYEAVETPTPWAAA